MALLDDPSNQNCISWTGRGMEFKLIEPEEVKIIFLTRQTINSKAINTNVSYSYVKFNRLQDAGVSLKIGPP